ncbi:porin family protein [Massilia sp. IC2-477]|uniref:outer membrane beta-barrel protein n=1 Tax=Massilia sp. IC2-477 TaxID=2887198 RepID=UPI001D0FCDC1|nr:outer membrane beta-barrel protein [Massilia sp. IC2-477]MCC2956719.1 porin family protein [Massilia sp. IC2-477]
MSNMTQWCARLGVSAAATLLCTQAGAADAVRYWGAHAGVNTPTSWNAQVDYGAGSLATARLDLDRGAHAGLVLGRQSGHARYELEYEAGRMKTKRLTIGPRSAALGARGRYQALFANVYRVEQLNESIDAFVGAGIGWGRATMPRVGLGDGCSCFGPASKSGFAWQLRAGLGYRVSAQSSVSLQTTWLALPRPEAEGPPAVRYARKRFGALTLGYSRQF